MIFSGMEDLEKSVQSMLEKAMYAAQYDVAKIIYVDHRDKAFHENSSFSRIGDKLYTEPLSHVNIHDIIDKIIDSKGTVVIENNSQSLDGSKKTFEHEAFVPFYNSDSEFLGFVYFAMLERPKIALTTNMDYLNAIKQLLHLIEQNLFKQKIIENLYNTVLLLCEIIHAKQPYMIGHLFSVSYWAEKIAKQMNISHLDIRKLQMATLLHDLGRIYISDTILIKTGKYTDEEYKSIQARIIHSYEVAVKLSYIYDLDNIPEIILNCQERIDGKGYPYGINGDNIPLLSKILYVSKAIASMQVNTQYRNAKTIEEIISELKYNTGTQFDPLVVDAAIFLLAYKKEEIDDCFTGLGMYVTIGIRYQDETNINIWGNLRKHRNTYLFNPMEKMPEIIPSRIIDCKLYLNVNDRIVIYKPMISKIDGDKIVISKILVNNDEKSFFIRWFFEGKLITKSKTIYKIFVNLIGGDFIDFYIFNNEIVETIKNGIVMIQFHDENEILLPGIIVFQQLIHDKMFFRFEYTNVGEGIRTRVFSAIFKKQLETRTLTKRLNETQVF